MIAPSQYPHVIECETIEDWLFQRRRGVGSSDAPIILGQSPWSDPLTLWSQKLGLNGFETDETEPMRWGHILEEPIAREYERRSGRYLLTNDNPYRIYRHHEHQWQQATPDRIQDRPGDDHPGILEVKTVNEFKSSDWSEGIPLLYQVQVQHQLAVTGLSWGTVCVLIGGQRLEWFDVQRDDRFISLLTEMEREFWECVENETRPNVTPSESVIKALGKLHPDDSGESIDLPSDALSWDFELTNIKSQIAELQKRKDLLEGEIKLRIGPATFGRILGTEVVYSWKTIERKGYEVAPSKSRQLKRGKAKS